MSLRDATYISHYRWKQRPQLNSLILKQRMCNNTQPNSHIDIMSTHGLNIRSKSTRKVSVLVHIWTTLQVNKVARTRKRFERPLLRANRQTWQHAQPIKTTYCSVDMKSVREKLRYKPNSLKTIDMLNSRKTRLTKCHTHAQHRYNHSGKYQWSQISTILV